MLSPSAFIDKISYAFQLATAQGPLCHEPVQGIAVFLEAVTVERPSGVEPSARETLGRLTGEVIKTVRDSIRQGFLDWSPRLLLAMYSCEIQASSKPFISCFRFHSCYPRFFVIAFSSKKSMLTISTLKYSRSSRPRLRRHYPPPRSHHHRASEGRHSIFHRLSCLSGRRIIWFQRRDQETHVRGCGAATALPRLRNGAGSGPLLGAVH